ncbi:MAG: ABC transporter ATP-binding protein [Deltaproteobacteria bacterium]|nr:ABC transporter ATP-binding protein [Deltaproteobacteria bacterium]
MSLAIAVRDVEKRYRTWRNRAGLCALDGVTLEVPRGVAFGLLGPNGAGKTTFIKVLLTIVRPERGLLHVLDGDPEDPRIRARVGYLPERLELPAHFTPMTFLASVSRLKRVPPLRDGLFRLLDRVGLASDANRKIGGFSKGQKQRLGLAAALVGTPDLLVLDEPTDGVDPMGRVEIRNLLGAELARGCTVFLNSHLLAETERVCSRIGIIAAGRLVRQGSLEELCRAEGRWRVRFAEGADAARLADIGFRTAGEEFLFAGDDLLALNRALDRARAAGAVIAEVRPDEKDLEQVMSEALTPAPAPLTDPEARP